MRPRGRGVVRGLGVALMVATVVALGYAVWLVVMWRS